MSYETHKVTLFDLQIMASQGNVTVKTFPDMIGSGLIGKVTREGVEFEETRINALTKRAYTTTNLYPFKQVLRCTKTIKQGGTLIADRRWPHQTLMTTGEGYRRPKKGVSPN